MNRADYHAGHVMVAAAFILGLIALAGVAFVWRDQRRLRRRIKQVETFARAGREEVRAVYARLAEAQLAARGGRPRMAVAFMAAGGEDVFLWDLFQGQAQGFFIEAGAFDGYNLAVTYVFEALGWTGLLVEAMPELAATCAARRPGSRVVQAALSRAGSTGTAKFTAVSEAGHEDVSALADGDRRWSGKYLRRVATTTIDVPLTTMDAALAGHAGPIDLVVLDVEGAEPDVLDGFDLKRWKPRVMMIEDLSKGKDDRVQRIAEAAGYVKVARVAVNDVYIRGDEAALIERARRIRVG